MRTNASSGSALLSLLHISSSALPIGAFAYSQGLEYALDKGWCDDRDSIQQWIGDNLLYGFARLDLPVYCRLYAAWQEHDINAIQHWNYSLLAFRESKELYDEDIQVGSAFAQWHRGQDTTRGQFIKCCSKPTVAAMHSLAACLGGIALSEALLGFCWAWLENQVACASKALPLGQTDAQQILRHLLPQLENVCGHAIDIPDGEIGSSTFNTAMASSFHEHQYSRLFRS